MKNPFRKKTVQMPSVPQEPRLSGYTEPHHSVAAKGAFAEVILKVYEVQRGPGRSEGAVGSVTELKRAVQTAGLYCNAELTSRMNALWEAVVEESMGGGSAEATRAARNHFTLGCRLALGTND